MYICDFSRSVGAGSAITRNTRGLTRSVMALIRPPLPAPSLPFEENANLTAFVLCPFLKFHKLDMKLREFPFVVLALEGAVLLLRGFRCLNVTMRVSF